VDRQLGSGHLGRPLLVTENDYGLRLYNGDTGVVVATTPDRLAAVFERGGELLELSPTRLAAVDTVCAMTIHKSQGSQFEAVAVLLPDPASPILTRELPYTAITRGRRRLLLAGPPAGPAARGVQSSVSGRKRHRRRRDATTPAPPSGGRAPRSPDRRQLCLHDGKRLG
jgi:ATP-dependent exoDNAse (exonuclease V) alpha subunit